MKITSDQTRESNHFEKMVVTQIQQHRAAIAIVDRDVQQAQCAAFVIGCVPIATIRRSKAR